MSALHSKSKDSSKVHLVLAIGHNLVQIGVNGECEFLRIRLVDGLPELLSNSDYVCSILPSTPETAGFLNSDALKACSKKVI